jgi:hypothetical protein
MGAAVVARIIALAAGGDVREAPLKDLLGFRLQRRLLSEALGL